MTQKTIKQISNNLITGVITIEYSDGSTRVFTLDQLPSAEYDESSLVLKVFGETINFDTQKAETVALAQTIATIVGTPQVGENLTAVLPSGWTGFYQWTLDGVDIVDATSAVYVVAEEDVGGEVACKVSNPVFTTSSVTAVAAPETP